VKRVDINYGGDHYSIADREVEDLLAEIARAAATSQPSWLRVNVGEGTLRPAHLLLGTGIPIAVVEIPEK
jgi:hypothetical protein